MFVWGFSEHQGRIVNKDYCILCMETPKSQFSKLFGYGAGCARTSVPYPDPSGILFHGPSFP